MEVGVVVLAFLLIATLLIFFLKKSYFDSDRSLNGENAETKSIKLDSSNDIFFSNFKDKEKSEKLESIYKECEAIKNTFRSIFSGKRYEVDTELREKVATLIDFIQNNLMQLFLNDEIYVSARDKKNENMILKKFQERINELHRILENPWLLSGPIVCFAGRYSAGKSSVLNALIGEKILSEDDLPQTALPTFITKSFSYNNELQKKAVLVPHIGDPIIVDRGTLRKISKNVFEKLSIPIAAFLKYAVVSCEGEIFKNRIIVDTPGIDPPKETTIDKELTKDVLSMSDVIFWVIDINDGTISDSAVSYFKKVTENKDIPIFVILNKVDTKPPSKVKLIKDKVLQDLKKEGIDIGENNILTFSTKKDVESFRKNVINILLSLQKGENTNRFFEIIDELVFIIDERKSKLDKHIKSLLEKIRDLESQIDDTDDNFYYDYDDDDYDDDYDDLRNVIKKIHNIKRKMERLLEKDVSWFGVGSEYYKLSIENYNEFNRLFRELIDNIDDIIEFSVKRGKELGERIGKYAEQVGNLKAKIDRLRDLERDLSNKKEQLEEIKEKFLSVKQST